jgi:hypothetical protein
MMLKVHVATDQRANGKDEPQARRTGLRLVREMKAQRARILTAGTGLLRTCTWAPREPAADVVLISAITET